MPAATYNIQIDQNASFELDIVWTTNTIPPVAVNLGGFTAKMQIRPSIGSTTVLATLTDSNGHIVLGGVNGTISLVLTAAQTLAFTWVTGVYDLDLVSPTGFATRLLSGGVSVNPAVTTI